MFSSKKSLFNDRKFYLWSVYTHSTMYIDKTNTLFPLSLITPTFKYTGPHSLIHWYEQHMQLSLGHTTMMEQWVWFHAQSCRLVIQKIWIMSYYNGFERRLLLVSCKVVFMVSCYITKYSGMSYKTNKRKVRDKVYHLGEGLALRTGVTHRFFSELHYSREI